ncbi:hydroxymyristoyl-ACP dehydratase [Legionella impletisoli]|uniref:Hydroxymyristoyl-ACP dehydratase n=1 Tax=Legionella impletisoli TaxID=343510 RepID=A0A917NB37_9GAMM|nr:hydroxymyristoyl-ACP dehydratase [Legionella impletisoli]GGI83367.1 hydroxymyristoyl-ACP dehydratase [Legionella impletisoli]
MRFLFVDRILELTPGQMTRGVKQVTNNDFYLTRAKDGRSCFIPSLIGETLGQLAAWNVMYSNDFTARPVAGIVSSAHLLRPVYVGETLLLESVIDAWDETSVRYHSHAYVDDEEVFRIDSALGPMLPMADFIDDATIRNQFFEIHSQSSSDENLTPKENNTLTSIYFPMSFDRVLDLKPGVEMVAEMYVNPTAPYFPDHFPKKPVLPMTVLLESKLNMANEFIQQSAFDKAYLVREMRKIKMNEFVVPGDRLLSHLMVKHQADDEITLGFRSEVNGKRVCVLEVVMTAKDL